MLLALRQGQLSKWFSGIGQEAISVGCATAVEPEDFLLPLHRNLGIFTVREVPLKKLFLQLLGKEGGFTKARDRSFHFGSTEHRIVGMISHLGVNLTVANGIALGHRLRGEGRVTLAFTGEGATSEGDFHEALNVAAVWDLPVLFVIENNGYALSTPTREQFRCQHLKDRAAGYGIEGHQVDGNDVLAVHGLVRELTDSMRQKPRPMLLECVTFRMRGHEEASGTRYVPPELFEEWAPKDPVLRLEQELEQQLKQDLKEDVSNLRAALKNEIDQTWEWAVAQPRPGYQRQQEYQDLFRDHPLDESLPGETTRELRLVDALHQAHHQALERHPDLVVMGQDVADYGGVFKVTEGLLEAFGPERVRNTPLCESAIVGAAVGLSVVGFKSIVEMQFSDFASCAFNQLINNVAKLHYRWGQNVDTVVRMPTGAGVGAGPFHSQSLEAIFARVPGLKVVYPAFAHDAKGLLLASVEDPNPVLFFEHKALYRRNRTEVPESYFTLPLGLAAVLKEGEAATVVTYGLGVHWMLELLEKHPNWELTVIDLRTLAPWDRQTVYDSVRRTSKALVLHEDSLTGGWGAEIAAAIGEHCFEYLDAPVMRLGAEDTPVPFAKELETEFLPVTRLESVVRSLLDY